MVICQNYLIHPKDYPNLHYRVVLLNALELKQPTQKVKQSVKRKIYLMWRRQQKILLKWPNLDNKLFNICFHRLTPVVRLCLQPISLVVGFSCRAYCWYNSLVSRWTFLIHLLAYNKVPNQAPMQIF